MGKVFRIVATGLLLGSFLAPTISAASLTGSLAMMLKATETVTVPEPGSLVLLVAGLASLAGPLRHRLRR